ncbi:hypothetical protein TNCV_1761511 [Trichonephila clavipes]|nr:hypothetical protein TNCV_1761511 [Trichonephila clavipes]
MPLSRMSNSTFAMPNIIDSHDMGLRTVLQSRRPKINAYSTPILAMPLIEYLSRYGIEDCSYSPEAQKSNVYSTMTRKKAYSKRFS